ncbi:hypothetical protein RND71_036299 [Anisodus tanguticus]|uniref:Proteasome alpha-type subunits domain-containing protein n=1 Tax=Anisodus tanguticus TaxID=243964 RepID=A0AAE1R6U0_9SOLA|nr:hypothetical protein RND71_036299 [Anisodus tanguticus]
MSSIRTGYDLSVTTFSPDGRVFQIEYAGKAVDNSGTVVGIKCKDGIVLGVEKLIPSKMMLPGSNRRIHSVHHHSGMGLRKLSLLSSFVMSLLSGAGSMEKAEILGLLVGALAEETPYLFLKDMDCMLLQVWLQMGGKLLPELSPKLPSLKGVTSGYLEILVTTLSTSPFCSEPVLVGYSVYGEPIPVKELAERVASYVHLCTLYWWLRPFGCGVILGGYDRDGPQLYLVEPSGVSYRYFGAAIGKGRQAAKTEIEKLKLSEMTCRQGVIEVTKIIYGVHDEAKDKVFELEMSWVCDESNRQHQKVPDNLLEEAKAAAKAALEDMDAD